MSRAGQKHPPSAAPLVRGGARGLPAGSVVDSQSHDWSQLILAAEGALRVRSGTRLWVVPAGHALWVPAGDVHAIRGVGHAIRSNGHVEMRTVYLPPGTAPGLAERIVVLPVTPLLHELILHTIERAPLQRGVPEHERLAGVLVDLLSEAKPLPLELPWPSHPRALAAARHIWANPADASSIAELARIARSSARTLRRLFVRETGLPLGRWRRRARLLTAVRALAEGRSVAEVAREVGYESTSGFGAMFHRQLGVTPGSL